MKEMGDNLKFLLTGPRTGKLAKIADINENGNYKRKNIF